MCRIQAKVWAAGASGAINLKNYKGWLNAVEFEPKSTRARPINNDVAVALTPVLNIAKKIPSTKWAFKAKSDRHFDARQAVAEAPYWLWNCVCLQI